MTHTIFRNDRNRRGGVLLAIRNVLQPSKLIELTSALVDQVEIIFVEITVKTERWLLGVYYSPPTDCTSLDILEDILNNLNLDAYCDIIVMGTSKVTGARPDISKQI